MVGDDADASANCTLICLRFYEMFECILSVIIFRNKYVRFKLNISHVKVNDKTYL